MIGFGSTSVDIARSLLPYAKLPIHISHRRGSLLISRWLHGKPIDRPFFNLDRVHASAPLTLSQRSEGMAKAATQLMHATWQDIPEEWGFSGAPGMIHKQPVAAEEVYDDLKKGDIVLVPAVKRVTGARTVELIDGRVVEADAIISAAGYKADFSLLGELDPTLNPPSAWTESKGHNGRPLGRWYYGVFSLDFPDSLANIETITYTLSATQNTDLASMVIAQVWAGKSSLPSRAEMEKQVDKDLAVVIDLAQKDDVQPYARDGWQWGLWADKMAGIGVLERVYGYSLKAWWFWLFDRKMYNMLKGGLMSPHIWRLFDDGKRKAWKGAREEIVKVNNL
jgi:dimethylaniline monooxygenase (N-oxide forming)